jgi:hypothetical protein
MSMMFAPIKRTRSKKAKVMLLLDEYDRDRLMELSPVSVTVQEKIRQIIKAFLDEDIDVNLDGDLTGL